MRIRRRSTRLRRARAFLSVGHDEYWSLAMYDHVKQAIDAGVNAAFFSGNSVDGVLDIRAMAEHFDKYEIPNGDASQAIGPKGRGSTGMPGFGGPQGGTRETCNWIAAAAVADGSTATVVDYVPVYSSPVGAAFAYWDKP